QAAAARTLGHHTRPQFHLRPSQPRHQEIRPRRALRGRARPRGRGAPRPHPPRGGPGIVANTYLEGTYSEVYPSVSQDEEGMKRLFTQFSFPGGIPSHVAPETPGSIHEGGELGYAISHAYGAAFDNPD